MKEYPNANYVTLEKLMLIFFKWNVNIPTAATFCEFYIEFISNAKDFQNNRHERFTSIRNMKESLALQVLEFLDLALLGKCFVNVTNIMIIFFKFYLIFLLLFKHRYFIIVRCNTIKIGSRMFSCCKIFISH